MNTCVRRLFKKDYLAILLLTGLSFFFHINRINEFPSGIHSWVQADRYAIAIGFTRNGLNFFKPETFNLNPYLPPAGKVTTARGITSVDFPVHEYIAALIMKITGARQPWCFRLYILLYSLAGICFLYLLARDITDSKFKAFFIVLFAATSPVYVYYQAGFLPSIPSLANISIAYYYYFKYIKSDSLKYFLISLIFFTLAALSRIPFTVFLITVFGMEIAFLVVQKKKLYPLKYTVFAISFSLIAGYFLYNLYLRTKYGSIFINYPIPPVNIQSFKELLKISLAKWKLQYLTLYHYIAFILITISNLYLIIAKRYTLIKIQKILLAQIILLFFIYSIYAYLMFRAFPDHDYYFLDTFYFIIILLIIYLLSNISLRNKELSTGFIVLLLLLAGGMIIKSSRIQKVRRNIGHLSGTEITRQNFIDSEKFLNSLGIPYSSRILVLDAYTPNLPFILMNRKGYAVLTTSKENITRALNWDFDYIVIQDIFLLSDVVQGYPDIVNHIEKIAGNGRISVYRLLKEYKKQTLLEFLKLDKKEPFFKEINNFDSINTKYWKDDKALNNLNLFSGSLSGFLDSTLTYGITFSLVNNPELLSQTRMILFKGMFYAPLSLQKCSIIVQIDINGSKEYYISKNLKSIINEQKKWVSVNLLFPIPKFDNAGDSELKIYLWNPGKEKLYYDNFEILIY